MVRVSKTTVFVESMTNRKHGGGIEVTASNGGPEGPPFVRFVLAKGFADKCYVGKKFSMTIEDEEN